MIVVDVITERLVRVTFGVFEIYVARVPGRNGGFEWWIDKPRRRVGSRVRSAIDQAIARASSGVAPPG